jgi:hypothetical protein
MNPLESAHAELEALVEQRNELEKKINAVTKTIDILEPFYHGDDLGKYPRAEELMQLLEFKDEVGITPAIEQVLRTQPKTELTPIQVRDQLVASGFILSPNNPMASVHQILKRLVARNGQFVSRRDEDGNTLYSFDPAMPPAVRRGLMRLRVSDGGPAAPTPSPRALASLPEPKTQKPVPVGQGALAAAHKAAQAIYEEGKNK